MREKLNFDAVQSGDRLYMYNYHKPLEPVVTVQISDVHRETLKSIIPQTFMFITLTGEWKELVVDDDHIHKDHACYSIKPDNWDTYIIYTTYREAEGRRRKHLKRKIKGLKKQRQYYINKRRTCDNIIKANDKFIELAEDNLNQKKQIYII